MDALQLLISDLDKRPLHLINDYKFILNPLTEQVPLTSPQLLNAAAETIICHMNIQGYDKIITEEYKRAILIAAVSLKTGLYFGMARWYPNNLATQVSSIFTGEYLEKRNFYICSIERGDRVFIIDEIISTGGTLVGMIKTLQKIGARIIDIIVIGEKFEYKGIQKVFEETGYKVKTLLKISVKERTSKVIIREDAEFG